MMMEMGDMVFAAFKGELQYQLYQKKQSKPQEQGVLIVQQAIDRSPDQFTVAVIIKI